MSNQKGFSKVAVIIIVLILIGGAYFVFSKKAKNVPAQNTENQNSQSNQALERNLPIKINPKDYSLIKYPIQQSPGFSQNNCEIPGSAGAMTSYEDARLVKNGTEIVIPSLIKFITTHEPPSEFFGSFDCSMIVDIFSSPEEGKYIYLEINHVSKGGPSSAEFDEIYRLDLSDLSIEKISFTFDRGGFKITTDGKRVVNWDMNGIYLSNLETKSVKTLYKSPQNQTLICGISIDGAWGMPWGIFDVKTNEYYVTARVCDKTRTHDGKPITVDNNGNIDPGSISEENGIELGFIQRISIEIPENQSN